MRLLTTSCEACGRTVAIAPDRKVDDLSARDTFEEVPDAVRLETTGRIVPLANVWAPHGPRCPGEVSG